MERAVHPVRVVHIRRQADVARHSPFDRSDTVQREPSGEQLFHASVVSLVDVDGDHERVRAYIRGAFRGEFLDPQYLALRLALWAISRTDSEIETVERHLYERYVLQMTDLIAKARPNLSRREARNRATDVIVTQNGLWLNWARHADHDDLDRGLARCDDIALGPSSAPAEKL